MARRQTQMFRRENIPISTSTLSDNVVAGIGTLVPIYLALIKETLGGKYLQSYETIYKVLRSGVKGKCHNRFYVQLHINKINLREKIIQTKSH